MRGLHSAVSDLRKNVFIEVARIAFESDDVSDDLEALPYKLSPTEEPKFRDSIYQERAIAAANAKLPMILHARLYNKRARKK